MAKKTINQGNVLIEGKRFFASCISKKNYYPNMQRIIKQSLGYKLLN